MSEISTSVPDVRIVTPDAAFGMSLVVSLRSTPFSITVVDPRGSAVHGEPEHEMAPAAAVVELTGAETVVELREMLRGWPSTRFLFVVRDMPLSASLARIVKESGGVILAKDEPAIVITATLIAMMMGNQAREA